MSMITLASILITLCAVFAYLNDRLFRLPPTIGIMAMALALSLIILLLPVNGIDIRSSVQAMLAQINFEETLMHGMLSFLLFAGALHVNLEDLGKQKWVVTSMAIFGTLFSTLVVGLVTYYLFPKLGYEIPLIYAFLFGALISPTDPVAVMSILRRAGVAKSLETKIVGESLFNDGIAVVIFISILGIVQGHGEMSVGHISVLFVQEAVGGVLLGLFLGYLTFLMLRNVDNYQVEILLTLSLVMGGYELAHFLHTSGPITMVVAGLLIGNHGKRIAMSEKTRQNLDNFWELMDEFLNAVLFLLIGLELLLLQLDHVAITIGVIMIPVLLAIRFIAVSIPIKILQLKRSFSPHVIKILTWGGLRGGISVALALSLPEGPMRDSILIITYCIVLFSILVQGLTIGKLVQRG